MMKQVLVCGNCSRELSNPVEIKQIGTPEFPNVDWIDQKPISPRGIALKSAEPFSFNPNPEGPKPYLEFTPQFWMRLDDILASVGRVKDDVLWQGCCGPSQGEPNRRCLCGEAVGVEMNDCWTSQIFIPAKGKTKWQNVKS